MTTKRHTWKPYEVALLEFLYPHEQTADIAQKLGLTTHQVYSKANALGIHKSEEFRRKELARQGERLITAGASSRFQPGQESHNKGQPMAPEVYAKCKATMFKPGRKPEQARNYQPIGTTRISKDGYLERKISDDTTIYPAKRWQFEHRLVWEAANGPIPEGHIVVFLPGKFTSVAAEITVDRLELISRAENMRRNTIHKYPEPLKEVIRMKASLTRQINKRVNSA